MEIKPLKEDKGANDKISSNIKPLLSTGSSISFNARTKLRSTNEKHGEKIRVKMNQANTNTVSDTETTVICNVNEGPRVTSCRQQSVSSVENNITQSNDKSVERHKPNISDEKQSQHEQSLRKSSRQKARERVEGMGEIGYCFTKMFPGHGLFSGMVVDILPGTSKFVYPL